LIRKEKKEREEGRKKMKRGGARAPGKKFRVHTKNQVKSMQGL